MARVFVALSGGVDSSVAAALLQEAGHEVVGAHLLCWDECEQKAERLDALRVAVKLGIPFLTFDFRAQYKERIFDPAIREYARGQTPNPDVLCNREIKFGVFLETALRHGADYIATGHYARSRPNNGEIQLLEGTDKTKDQSYFLWMLRRYQLTRSLFPLGDFAKSEVREIARRLELPTAEKKDSQGLCFVGKINFAYFLRAFLPRQEGPVLLADGRVVGRHDGVAFYTIGQRHGLGIGGGTPYYVAEKDVERNILLVGKGANDPVLFRRSILVDHLNWISDFRQGPCQVRIRHRQATVPALVTAEGRRARVCFDVPQRGVAPGQSAVFYDGEVVLGGGIIL